MTTETKAIKIEVGDYICSDFFSPIQGFVKAFGLIGKKIPTYRIETPHGTTEYIIQGQAILLWTKEEYANPIKQRPINYREWHDKAQQS